MPNEGTPHTPSFTMTAFNLAAASLAVGASLISFTAPAARADVYDSFGIQGGCNSGSFSMRDGNRGMKVRGRDCSQHQKWVSKEAARNRDHETQTQLIGLGGNLITGLVLGNQTSPQPPSPEPTAHQEVELALLKQQQQIELLKLQLQMQQQQQVMRKQTLQAGYAPQGQVLMQKHGVQPVYQQPSAAVAPTAYAPAPYAY